MQHAEIERDFLEAAAGHEADERAFGKPVAKARDGKPGGCLGREAAMVERCEQGIDPAPLEGA